MVRTSVTPSPDYQRSSQSWPTYEELTRCPGIFILHLRKNALSRSTKRRYKYCIALPKIDELMNLYSGEVTQNLKNPKKTLLVSSFLICKTPNELERPFNGAHDSTYYPVRQFTPPEKMSLVRRRGSAPRLLRSKWDLRYPDEDRFTRLAPWGPWGARGCSKGGENAEAKVLRISS